jgi:hypothetical protein
MLRALTIFCVLATAGCTREVHWSEQAALNDGTQVLVERSYDLGYRNPLMNLFALDRYESSLVTRHPRTGARIRWHGDYGLVPIRLDYVGDTAYLAVIPTMCDSDLTEYGIPKLPYLVLQRDGRSWKPIPWEARPGSLRQANLLADRPSDGRHLSAEAVARVNAAHVGETAGFFQIEFPSSFDDWEYKHKAEWGRPCGSRSADLRRLPHWR